MSAAVSKFVTDLSLHFPPKHARPELEAAWLKSMADALRGYPAHTLEEAAKHIIATRKYTSFPLPAECRSACVAVAEYQAFIADKARLPTMRTHEEWSSERQRLADDLIKSGMGKQAASGQPCWILALWHFCRKNQRLPSGSEIEQCKRDARDLDESHALCVRGKAGPMSKDLEKLGSSMLAKRKKLAEEVMGK